MKTNNDFSAHSAKGLGGASVRRAAMMLLMMLLTATTAWANDYTVTYQAKFAYMGGLYNIILQRNDNKATIADKNSVWPKTTSVCVDDEYYITFKPSQDLSLAVTPNNTATGFIMSTGTSLTATVASNSSYYIKQVKLLNQAATTGTSAATAPNSRSATVTASGDIQFNFIEVCLTDDYYGTITPEDGLTLTATASLTYNNTNYYKNGTEITMNAPANRAIDAATGVSGATIAASKRSYTFTMPKQDVSPGATMSEVHTISCPSGLTVTSSPYCTDNTTKYYKKGETYTLTVDDANKVIQSFNASGASGSSVANDKKSATVTIGTSNVTVSATLQTISGTTTDDGLSWSLAQDGSGNYTRLTISGSGAMTNYQNDGGSTGHTTAPWGYGLTSVSIADGVTTIGNYAFCGCQSLTTVTLPASVTSLNQGAFYNCSGLQRIDIEHDGAVSLGSNVFPGNLQYIVFPSIAAEQANTTGNWSSLAEKLRAKFGNQHFGVTKDKTNTAVYAIATADDLRNLASAVNGGNDGSGKTFLQTDDIDLGGSNSPFTPIGYGRHFQGTYDGGSHTVSGLYIYAGNDNCIGFFGSVKNGTVRNVILVSPDVTSTYNQSYDICVGALIGYVNKATVENCHVVSPTVNATGSGTKYIGTLIGETLNGTRVTNCSFYAGTGNASTGIGNKLTTNGDVSRAYKVTLGSNAGLPNPPATGGFIVQGSHYYAQGATAQLSYTGSIPNGYRVVYTVSPDNTGATVTEQGVLTMGSADITITAKLSIDISTGTIADIADQTYTGSAIVPDITLTVGDRVLTAGTDYTVSCTNNVAVGTATLTATGMGDYTGTLTKDFRICYADKTGSCGTGVTYTLHDADQDGHYEQLTISGTGAMTDFNAPDDVPWKAYLDDITSVIVQSGVTHIGAYAFYYCRYLTSVSLPEGLTSIGDQAFIHCDRLSALTVPASVESVGDHAFDNLADNISGCTLTFASGSRLTSVGRDAFFYAKASVDMSACTSLTSVPNAFNYFNGNVTFPRSLTSIAEHCFRGCESTTKVYIHVPDNYLLTVNNESVSATDGKADITSNIGVGTNRPAVTLSCIPNPADFVDNGDGSYTIHTATGWNIFCDILNDYPKGYFTGKTVTLGDNITVSRMAGSSNHDFTGTFDGNKKTLTVNYSGSSYVAPFPYVDGATIQDLVVDGTISSTGTRAAGVIGETGTTISHITNCVSSSTISGGNFSGGFSIGGNVAIEGCVFDGTIDSGGNSGGFVGYSQGALTITNCLFAPQSGSSAKGTFHFNGTAGTLTNCYYTETLGTEQGKQRRSIAAGANVTISNIALTGSSQNYDVSGIRAYDNGGINYNNTLYYGSGDQVSLTLGHNAEAPLGYQYSDYTASTGTLSGSDNPYTLTMPNEDVTISATLTLIEWSGTGNASKPWVISYPSQLDLLAQRVNGGNDYGGKYFVLGADIEYDPNVLTIDNDNDGTNESNYTAIGGYNRNFDGHFDGQGHTISGIRINKGGDSNSDMYQGIFGVTGSGADLRGITLADARITGYHYTGGIVGYNKGTVSDCHVGSDVAVCTVLFDVDNHGGIVGDNYGTVEHCTSAVTLTFSDASSTDYCSNYGGIAGSNSATLRNNLVVGAVVPGTNDNGSICGWYGGNYAILENNYYACTVAGVENATNVGTVYGDVYEDNGAVPCTLHTLTLGENITATGVLIKQGGTISVASGSTVALSYSGLGANQIALFSLNDTELSGNSFTMPAADATVSATVFTVWGIDLGADGSAKKPYVISRPADLDLLAQRVNGGNGYWGQYFVLANDITYSHTTDWKDANSTENNFTAIGCYNRNFNGHFDGRGHTISGIRIYKDSGDETDEHQGIFGYTDGADIRGITLADARITGYNYVGGIVGRNIKSTVSDCHVASNVVIHGVQEFIGNHGGIVGFNTGTVCDCTSAATLTQTVSGHYYGGIAGYNEYATLRHNLAIGAVVPAAYEDHGAICGHTEDGTIQNNYYYVCKVASNNVTPTGVGCGYIFDGEGYFYNADMANVAEPGIILYDHSSRTDLNSYILTTVGNNAAVPCVMLSGRTLYKDGDWNTLCLPFSVTVGSDVMEGATAMTLNASTSGFNSTTGELTLNFDAVGQNSTIAAGTPFIVKWGNTEGSEPTENTENPVFRSVTVSSTTPGSVTSSDGYVTFLGTYNPATIYAAPATNLYLGGENQLYYPTAEDFKVNAFRAWFQLKKGLTAGEPSSPNAVRAFNLNFGDETNAVFDLNNKEEITNNNWYSLDGVKLDGKPTKKGLYIHGGKKVVVP